MRRLPPMPAALPTINLAHYRAAPGRPAVRCRLALCRFRRAQAAGSSHLAHSLKRRRIPALGPRLVAFTRGTVEAGSSLAFSALRCRAFRERSRTGRVATLSAKVIAEVAYAQI